MTRVLLADDHKILRQGLRTLLEQESDIQVVGEAENGRSSVKLAGELAPDVVIMGRGHAGPERYRRDPPYHRSRAERQGAGIVHAQRRPLRAGHVAGRGPRLHPEGLRGGGAHPRHPHRDGEPGLREPPGSRAPSSTTTFASCRPSDARRARHPQPPGARGSAAAGRGRQHGADRGPAAPERQDRGDPPQAHRWTSWVCAASPSSRNTPSARASPPSTSEAAPPPPFGPAPGPGSQPGRRQAFRRGNSGIPLITRRPGPGFNSSAQMRCAAGIVTPKGSFKRYRTSSGTALRSIPRNEVNGTC